MFRRAINVTPFTTYQAYNYFKRISSVVNQIGDVTLISTLRALVFPRLGDEDCLYLSSTQRTLTESAISHNAADDIVRYAIDNVYNFNSFDVIALSVEDDVTSDSLYSKVVDGFLSVYEDFQRRKEVTDFFRNSIDVACFTNEEYRRTILFVKGRMNMRIWHYLQSAIPAYLPWYLQGDGKQVTEDEFALLSSLREDSEEHYINILNDMIKAYDFRSLRIREFLAGFESRSHRRELDRERDAISQLKYDFESYQSRMRDILRSIDEKNIRILGLEQAIDRADNEGENELMEYFLRNKRLIPLSIDNNHFEFCVIDYLTYYDPEAAESMLNNRRSYAYAYVDSEQHREDMKLLMTGIFIDERIKLKVCAKYELVLSECVRGVARADYPDEAEHYLPNPHIDRYACLGNHEYAINEFIRDNNYIGAVEQCVASCRSLNFLDGPVMSEFFGQIHQLHDDVKCFELPDGKSVSKDEAIQWLMDNPA